MLHSMHCICKIAGSCLDDITVVVFFLGEKFIAWGNGLVKGFIGKSCKYANVNLSIPLHAELNTSPLLT